MSAAVLRIFSGLHLGAEIELIEGVYVIGTDDSCDLILSDSSLKSRHAALRVSCSGSTSTLSVEALDGNVILNGTKLEDENDVAPLVPFQLGLVRAAWQHDNNADRDAGWREVEALLAPTEAAKAASSSPLPPPAESAEASSDIAAPASDSAEAEEEAELSLPEDTSPSKPKRLRDLCLIASIVLMGALCFNWTPGEPEPTQAQIMRQLLNEAGYNNLNVVPGKQGVTVTGRIATDRERGRLLKLAQLMDFPVYLTVTVHSDAADAVRASFNALGLWPEVTELPPSSRPGVRVRGYIRNGFLEEMALSTTMRNVPGLRQMEGGKPSMEIFRDIRHEQDVMAELEPALMAEGLENVQKVFLPGRIELRGMLTPKSKAALVDTARAVEKKLGVPIPFDIINEAEEKKPQSNLYTNHGDPVQEEKPSADPFKVVSVSMGAMKFVTLDSGERVFEGGELPGGYILEHIDVDALTLKKSGKSTRYPLRGDHE